MRGARRAGPSRTRADDAYPASRAQAAPRLRPVHPGLHGPARPGWALEEEIALGRDSPSAIALLFLAHVEVLCCLSDSSRTHGPLSYASPGVPGRAWPSLTARTLPSVAFALTLRPEGRKPRHPNRAARINMSVCIPAGWRVLSCGPSRARPYPTAMPPPSPSGCGRVRDSCRQGCWNSGNTTK